MKLPPEVLGPLVNSIALAHDLRPDIVMCVILQESECDTAACRFEPHYQSLLAPKTRQELSGWHPEADSLPNLATEKMQRCLSWGLMQVMGETARWCAKVTDPFLTELCNPEAGIEAGCRVLSFYMGKENKNYTRALARYNAGSVGASGLAYAERVLGRLKRNEHVKFLQSNHGF